MRKIALTGAHGTGKSTLVSELPAALSKFGTVHVCREAPRLITHRVGDDKFFRRENNTPARQALIFLEHLMEERRQQAGCDIMIADRTLVDHLAYSHVLFPSGKSSPEFETYKALAFESLTEYEVIFKLPIEFPPIDDGVRESAAEFQAQIDGEMDALYSEAGISFVEIRGTVAERVSRVVQYL